MASRIQQLNETIRTAGGRKVADNEQDTEAIFTFPTSGAAETVAQQASGLGAYARQAESVPTNVFIAIR